MKGNINKMLSMYENEELNRRVLGNDYYIDVTGNLQGNYLHCINEISKSANVNSVIYISSLIHFDEVEKFLSYVRIDDCDDWRLPTLNELSSILSFFKSKEAFSDSVFWSSEISKDTGYPMTMELFNNGKILKGSYKSEMWKFSFFLVR